MIQKFLFFFVIFNKNFDFKTKKMVESVFEYKNIINKICLVFFISKIIKNLLAFLMAYSEAFS